MHIWWDHVNSDLYLQTPASKSIYQLAKEPRFNFLPAPLSNNQKLISDISHATIFTPR